MTPEEYYALLNKVDPKTGLPFNEADLTDAELNQRIEAYKNLGTSGEPVDRATVERQIRQILPTYDANKIFVMREGYSHSRKVREKNYDEGQKLYEPLVKTLTDFVVKARRLPDAGELRDEAIAHGINSQDAQDLISNESLVNFIQDQGAKNRIAQPLQPKDYRLDINRINDTLATRADENAKTGEQQNFLVETPEALKRSRQNFLAEQEAGAQNYLTERISPQVLRELNVRGLAESPDVVSEIARRGAGLQATIEDSARQLEQQDAAFFADAAFRINTAKLNQKEADFRASLDVERTRARQEQENRFQTAQAGIKSDFEMDMLKREQDRNMALKEAGINLDSSNRSAANDAANAEQIGSSIGQTVGTAVKTRTAAPSVNDTKQAPSFKPNFSRVG